MPAYHQMGHDSQNLLFEKHLSGFAGAILSPLNADEAKTKRIVDDVRAALTDHFEVVFDPQLYFPRTSVGRLPGWDHFPDDVETADLTSDAWWRHVAMQIAEVSKRLEVDATCSPVVVPRAYSNEYYARSVDVAEELATLVETDVWLTTLVGFSDLGQPGRAEQIASVITRSQLGRAYMVVQSDKEPRRELDDEASLAGVMRLIAMLEDAGIAVTVGFSSSDIVLWKAAGASSCATGKFFNLRRFASARFEEQSGGGGGQLPYWFEENLLGFLRGADVLRIAALVPASDATRRNPYSAACLAAINEGTSWLAESWRQFLWWFADYDRRADQEPVNSVKSLLKNAEQHWVKLETGDVLMEERRNDGAWLRAWRRASSVPLR